MKKKATESSLDPRKLALECVRFALEKKAGDLVLLEVSELSSLADYFLICSGRSDRQVQAIADSIAGGLTKAGRRPLSTEGYDQGHWVLIDFGDVIAHIFYEPVRGFYDLERLWATAKTVTLPEPYRSQVRELKREAV